MATKRKTSSGRRGSGARRGSGQRELLKGRNATSFALRTSKGRGSLAADRRRKATKRARSGHGDRRAA